MKYIGCRLMLMLSLTVPALPLFAQEEGETIIESRLLLLNGGFDDPAEGAPDKPRGWRAENAPENPWGRDSETKLVGAAALRVLPSETPASIISDAIPLEPGLRAISGSVMAKGADAEGAMLRWSGPSGVLREDAFRATPPNADGWFRLTLGEVEPPEGARKMALLLTSKTVNAEPVWWDSAQLVGEFESAAEAGVFINQVGYECLGVKRFTAWSNFLPGEARFAVVDISGAAAFEGTLSGGDRVLGADGSDWGQYYWRAEFSPVKEPGSYRIQIMMDNLTAESPIFNIAMELLWMKTFDPAWQCFTPHRCGGDAPGYHAPCHLDDAVEGASLAGGWHDGSAYDKRNAPRFLWELARAFGIVQWRIGKPDEASPEQAALRNEVLWGANYMMKTLRADGTAFPDLLSNDAYWGPPEKETDNQPNTGDERKPDPDADSDPSLQTAALARAARFIDDNAELIEAAKRGLNAALAQNRRTSLQFSAAMDLFLLTQDEAYRKMAEELFGKPDVECVESFIDYESEFDYTASFDMAVWLIEESKKMVERAAANPFGVYVPEKPAGFFTGSEKPHSMAILEAAALVAKAYRFAPNPDFQGFVYDQINWTLGNNPEGICLMEGVGSTGVPSYYHRYSACGVARGAVTGAIANGIGYALDDGVPHDRPWFDTSGVEKPEPRTNGCSLLTNAYYVSALANLKRIRLGEENK